MIKTHTGAEQNSERTIGERQAVVLMVINRLISASTNRSRADGDENALINERLKAIFNSCLKCFYV